MIPFEQFKHLNIQERDKIMKKFIKISVIIFCMILLSMSIYVIGMQNQNDKKEFEQMALFIASQKRYQIFEPVYTIYNPFVKNYIIKMKGEQEVLYVTIDKNKNVDILFDIM